MNTNVIKDFKLYSTELYNSVHVYTHVHKCGAILGYHFDIMFWESAFSKLDFTSASVFNSEEMRFWYSNIMLSLFLFILEAILGIQIFVHLALDSWKHFSRVWLIPG